MYAVIKTGGKQYRVEEGMKLKVEKLPYEVGQTVEFDALMIKKDDGSVELNKGKVVAKILAHGKGKKLIVFKYRPKKNYRRWKGHRQPYTEIQIEKISE
ncbi:MAG: 50S ribosomal protein L21, partial [Aquificae bacterium]|nr:50S ribosomal protein L21 [Aquificota bacterium]